LSARLTYTDNYHRRDYSWPIKFAPAIIRANKQISAEAAQVLYNENDWVVLKFITHIQKYRFLDGFPNFVGLYEDQIPQPVLEITIKELAVELLPQRTFIFTLEAFSYLIEQLWDKATIFSSYNSMIFELFLFNKAPSRHTFLNDQIVRSFDQIQGFTVLIILGDIETKVVRHLTRCMTLGQSLQDVGAKMVELFSRGENSFKRQDFTLASRYWDRLNSFWAYRRYSFLRKRITPISTSRYSIQDFMEATLTIILKMDLGQRMIDLHNKQYQRPASNAQNALDLAERFINQYSLNYHVPPGLETKIWICKSAGQFALGDRVGSNLSHDTAVTLLCLDPRFASHSVTEVSQELEWARAKYLEEQEDHLTDSKENEIPLALETHATLPGWRLLEAWMDLSE
jgi:hypothetical protein